MKVPREEALLVKLGEEGEVFCCSTAINIFCKYFNSETAGNTSLSCLLNRV